MERRASRPTHASYPSIAAGRDARLTTGKRIV